MYFWVKLYVLHTLWSIKCHHTVGELLLSPCGIFCVQSEEEDRERERERERERDRQTDRDRELLERDLRFDLLYDIV